MMGRCILSFLFLGSFTWGMEPTYVSDEHLKKQNIIRKNYTPEAGGKHLFTAPKGYKFVKFSPQDSKGFSTVVKEFKISKINKEHKGPLNLFMVPDTLKTQNTQFSVFHAPVSSGNSLI